MHGDPSATLDSSAQAASNLALPNTNNSKEETLQVYIKQETSEAFFSCPAGSTQKNIGSYNYGRHPSRSRSATALILRTSRWLKRQTAKKKTSSWNQWTTGASPMASSMVRRKHSGRVYSPTCDRHMDWLSHPAFLGATQTARTSEQLLE